ncbi:MAG: prolyl oligopeptidase family serine peptidase, partial [Ignavibacteriaceae bacterium]|nr:prolyl oligopeptidase family serine peptidase [Ignavibacteriaceae bacterium]
YASNQYVVFIPDISYEEGFPGKSAYNCIVGGTLSMIEQFPFIDRENIALQGQSWGGYQTAFLITQTNLYKAAMAGAPVSNMTSAYGGIRWGSGLVRQFQYEKGQSRIGGSLWDRLELYIENSPLFFLDRVNTPLLIMHNDKDDAVPWYQGIELYTGLRRLQKPVWMLNYTGDVHNLKEANWGNRVDLSKRMLQFFDHYLKGSPAPKWMTEGVPAILRDKVSGY